MGDSFWESPYWGHSKSTRKSVGVAGFPVRRRMLDAVARLRSIPEDCNDYFVKRERDTIIVMAVDGVPEARRGEAIKILHDQLKDRPDLLARVKELIG